MQFCPASLAFCPPPFPVLIHFPHAACLNIAQPMWKVLNSCQDRVMTSPPRKIRTKASKVGTRLAQQYKSHYSLMLIQASGLAGSLSRGAGDVLGELG